MGHSRGGLTIKIHARLDAEGRPIRLKLPPPGRGGDAPVGTEFVADLDEGAILIADRAYDTNPIRDRFFNRIKQFRGAVSPAVV